MVDLQIPFLVSICIPNLNVSELQPREAFASVQWTFFSLSRRSASPKERHNQQQQTITIISFINQINLQEYMNYATQFRCVVCVSIELLLASAW